MVSYDFIIVGAGSAGCVLADKLSASGNYNILLIEAGSWDNNFWINTPIGYGVLFTHTKYNWCYESEEEPGLNNRKIFIPRGKVIGGSSSINALVYHRGHKSDYDDWATFGNKEWNYDSVKSYFKSYENLMKNNEPYTNSQNTSKNLLAISNVWDNYHSLKHDFLEASSQVQLKFSKDGFIEGEGIGPYLITTKDGKRFSSAKAFLKPSQLRSNLKILSKTLVKRINFKKGRAVSVECEIKGFFGKSEITFYANNEIILSSGAISSPQLLQVSGIGCEQLLKKHNIKTILNQPNVGKHLQDHLGISYYHKSRKSTLNQILGTWPGRIKSGLEYIFFKSGPLSLSVNQIGGIVKTSKIEKNPNVQLYLNPASYSVKTGNKRPLLKTDKFPGFILSFNPCRPKSRGKVEIQSSDINVNPIIKCKFLNHPDDLQDIVKGARLIGSMQETQAIKELISEPPQNDLSQMSNEEIIDDFRNRASTIYHPSCTCRMGQDPETSVVDSKLQVHGIDGLRVVDASIFPNITSSNTNAPTIMLAHKAAAMICSKYN